MPRTLKFLTVGFLIVGFVALSVDARKSKGSLCKGSGTQEQFNTWLKGMESKIAKSGTPVYTDELLEAWQNNRLEQVLNDHKIPIDNLPPRSANSKGPCSPVKSAKGSSSGRGHKSSSSRHSKGSSSSRHSKGSSSSGHSKGSRVGSCRA